MLAVRTCGWQRSVRRITQRHALSIAEHIKASFGKECMLTGVLEEFSCL